MFDKAIVRKPCQHLAQGLTHSTNLGIPDFVRACEQHAAYIEALQSAGLEVTILPADEAFPDSVFVEDTALLTAAGAIITNPGAPSRRGEVLAMQAVLQQHFATIQPISPPGTIEAGDIMAVDQHYFIGLSERTNAQGARQMISLLEGLGLTASTIPFNEVLHLKTGVNYLGSNTLLVSGEFCARDEFSAFKQIEISPDEEYAANSLRINDLVLVPAGHPKSRQAIQAQGFTVLEVDVSEYQKLDGGLSCLSLRFKKNWNKPL